MGKVKGQGKDPESGQRRKLSKAEQRRQEKERKLNMKKSLAALVKEHPHIWKLEHPLHSRPDAVTGSWIKINSELGLSGN